MNSTRWSVHSPSSLIAKVGIAMGLTAGVALIPSIAMAQVPFLVKNINQTVNATASSSNPSSFAQVGGQTFFISAGEGKGNELWISDGTPAGTTLIKDVNPGSANGATGPLLPFNGGVLFSGNDGTTGNELWFSDGTASGTVLLLDISPGTTASSPNTFVDMGSYALFTANNDSANGNELWRTDGTIAGTFMVKDIFPGLSASSPAGTTRIGSFAYFRAQGSLESGGTNFELWRTDGTDAGTFLVKNIRVATSSSTGSSSPAGFTEFNGFVYFAANEGSTAGRTGVELWRTDGTEVGTTLVSDINTGTGSGLGNTPTIVTFNNKLYFFAAPPTTGFELHSYDDVNGVQLVADINPGTTQSNPNNLTVVGSQLFYTTSFSGSGTNITVSDGTGPGTSIVAAVPGGFETIVGGLTVHQGRVFFAADDVVDGSGSTISELWVSDGTVGGTQQVADLVPGTPGSQPQNIFSTGTQVLFSALASTPDVGRELWTTDGTTPGTVLLKDLNPGDFNTSAIASMAELNGQLIFSADDGLAGKELWTSDGTEAGTSLLLDIAGGPAASSPADPGVTFPDGFVAYNGALFFNALVQNVFGIELWRTDGTEPGTQLLRDINVLDQTDFAPEPAGMTVLNGQLVFRAREPFTAGGAGSELWTSDGTSAGTMLLADIRPGGTNDSDSSSTPQNITFFDRPDPLLDWIFFSATANTTLGNELWRSDGTAAGTVLVKDIRPASPFNSNPANLAQVGDKLFFSAFDSQGNEPFVSDGTDAGTFQLVDLRTGTLSSNPGPFAHLNSLAIFQADTGTSGAGTGVSQPVGRELFGSDGTTAGTFRIKDIRPGTSSGLASNVVFAKLGGFLYFAANDGVNGNELWRTDGTETGTTLFADINPGSGDSLPTSLTVIDGVLYFSASDGGGTEPYSSDGVTVTLLGDINPDGASAPTLFTKAGNRVFFSANDGPNGAELWAIDLTITPAPCPGDYDNSGSIDLLDLLAFNGDWSSNLGQSVAPGTNGDYNNSGTVDLLDLLAFNGDWSSNLGQACP